MSLKQPLVSVICDVYNHELYIKDCLEGFINQRTDFNYVVLVHDDASTDNTPLVLANYVKQYPNLFSPVFQNENKYSKGISIWKTFQFPRVKTKYVAFCEGDDYWSDSSKLQKQVDFLETHPDYSMCFHSAKKQYECNTISWLRCENIEDRDYSATEVFVNWIVPTASILCRSEAIEFRLKMSGDNRLLNGDIALILSSAMIGKIRGMHEQMSVYRVQSSGITYDLNAKKKRAMRAPHHFECLRDNFPIVDRRPLDDTISKTYFERALVQDSFRDRLRDFYQSLRNDPRRFFSMAMHTIWNSLKS